MEKTNFIVRLYTENEIVSPSEIIDGTTGILENEYQKTRKEATIYLKKLLSFLGKEYLGNKINGGEIIKTDGLGHYKTQLILRTE